MAHNAARANGPADNGTPFGELLELLNYRDGETLAVCWQHPQHRTHFASRFTTPAGAAAEVSRHAADADVWFSVNPIRKPRGGGRGTDGDVTRCAALFVDIDVKPGGVTDGETAEAITDDLAKALGQRPIAVVTTGHGWHIYWATDDGPEWVLDTSEKRTAARALYRRVDRLARTVAKDRGCSVDNVGQLNRVLRVPGTVNRKADPIPVTLTTEYPYGGGGPVSFSGVLDVLDERDVPELAEDREQFGEVISDPSGWRFGEATHPYVAAMIAGWRDDLPGNRHPWLVSQATRLACAHRLGLITAADHAHAVEALAARFDWLLAHHGTPRKADHGDAAAFAWGKQRAASFTDERAAADLGVDLDAVPLSLEAIDLTTYGDTAAEPTPEQRDDAVKAAKADLAAVMTRNLDLFGETEVLAGLAAFAEARKVGRWTLVGGVMVRTVAALHPSIVLPATIGGEVSLNLLLAQCGVPGSGKGASDNAVSDAAVMMFDNYTAPRLPLLPIGTGEGINRAYAHGVPVPGERRSETVFHARHALFSIRDIVTLEKLADRAGATIIGELLKAYMGEELGFTNAGRETNVVLPQHSYRLGLLMGVQPDCASILLDAVARGNGLTHRILALPVTDLRQRSGRPETGTPVTLTLPGDLHRDPFSDDMTLLPLDVPTAIAEALIEGQNAKNLDVFGESDNTPLSGHRGLSRLKLASTLGLMHGSTSAVGFWEMAERFTEVSDAMMAAMVAASQHSEAIVAGEQGRRDGHRRTAADDTIRLVMLDRVRERVLTVLRQQTDWMPHSGLANAVSKKQRDYLTDALGGLLRDGRIEAESGEYKGQTVVRYRIAAAAA